MALLVSRSNHSPINDIESESTSALSQANHASFINLDHLSAHSQRRDGPAYPWEAQDNIFAQPGHVPTAHLHKSGISDFETEANMLQEESFLETNHTLDTTRLKSEAIALRCKACKNYTGAPNQPFVPGFGGESLIREPLPNDHKPFAMTLLHTNDIHAHMDEFSSIGQDCSAEDYASRSCFGGIARIKYLLDYYRRIRKHVYLFDAGDQFQGNMFYSYYKGNVTAEFMNGIEYDVFAVGNHEFDDGPAHLAKFLHLLDAPTISSNIDSSSDPNLKHMIAPYVILTKYGVRIGVVGYLTPTIQDIANVGRDLRFSDPVEPVQRAVDGLHDMGVHKIICVSHNGYADDIELARKTRGFDLIVGGHSHTLLHDALVPGSKGPYPTKVTNLDGKHTYIVQAKIWGEWLGYLEIAWDEHSVLTHLNGRPIHLTMDVPQDPIYRSIVSKWRQPFDAVSQNVLAKSSIELSNQPCKVANCALGWLVANALRMSAIKCVNSTELPVIGLMHEGGLRGTLPKGDVRLPAILNVLPFSDPWSFMTTTGAWIHKLLENLAAGAHMTNGRRVTAFAQFAGLQALANVSKPAFSRVSDIQVQHPNQTWVPLDMFASYIISMPEFVALGGDNIVPDLVAIKNGAGTLPDILINHLAQIKVIEPRSEPGFELVDVQ